MSGSNFEQKAESTCVALFFLNLGAECSALHRKCDVSSACFMDALCWVVEMLVLVCRGLMNGVKFCQMLFLSLFR